MIDFFIDLRKFKVEIFFRRIEKVINMIYSVENQFINSCFYVVFFNSFINDVIEIYGCY